MTEIVVTDEAVKKAADVYWETEGNRAVCMRAALEAARPHLQVQDLCHNGHPFEPGTNTDNDPPNPAWCDVCGEARRPRVQVDRQTLALLLADTVQTLDKDEEWVIADRVIALLRSSGEEGK